MRSTEQEVLGGADLVGVEALRHMGRGAAKRWVTRKLAPQKTHNRPRLARDTRWWRVLSNRLRELLLMEPLLSRRPHLPQQLEQIERLRVHLHIMATEAQAAGDWSAEFWRIATQTCGENELLDLKDVHRKALMVTGGCQERFGAQGRRSHQPV